jgi:hypothetical protein
MRQNVNDANHWRDRAAAMRVLSGASSFVSSLAADRRPGSFS